MTGNGPYIVSPSAINAKDGTGVNGDNGDPAFSGQVFFNPAPGTLGVLQRRLFDGPWILSLNMSVLKTVKLNERQTAELRMDAFNMPNHPSFIPGDQNINQTTFGVVGSTFPVSGTSSGSRVVQFALHYRF